MSEITKQTENSAECGNKSKPLLQAVFLSPYFPHKVKVLFDGRIGNITQGFYSCGNINNKWFLSLEEDEENSELSCSTALENVKLILKPLSDLIDNILDDGNDENYKLSCELAELLNTTDCSYFVKSLIESKYYAVDVRLWGGIEEWLNKNHFDWKFNLIKQGLAISVHDVE